MEDLHPEDGVKSTTEGKFVIRQLRRSICDQTHSIKAASGRLKCKFIGNIGYLQIGKLIPSLLK